MHRQEPSDDSEDVVAFKLKGSSGDDDEDDDADVADNLAAAAFGLLSFVVLISAAADFVPHLVTTGALCLTALDVRELPGTGGGPMISEKNNWSCHSSIYIQYIVYCIVTTSLPRK